jgi:hypothetical protein
MKHYMGHIPGWQFAVDIYAENEVNARRKLREIEGVNRLPSGSSVWLHTPPPAENTTRRDSPYSAASGM